MIVKTERNIAIAHYLPNYNGKCKNLHGHNLRVVVWVEGKIDKNTGMVVDFVDIKEVIDRYDHQNLNTYLPNPTAEHFATLLAEEIYREGAFKSVKVRVYESEDSYAEEIISNF